VVAAIWMRAPVPAPVPAPAGGNGGLAPIAGGSPEADVAGAPSSRFARPAATFVAVVAAAAVIFFGIFPSPLFNLASHAAQGFGLL
jgi:hypothetical protein